MRRIVSGIVSAFGILTVLSFAQAQEQAEIPVVRSTVRVEAARANYFQFKLPSYYRDGRIAGNALAAGGSGNDIRVLILTEKQFQAWTRSPRPEALYDSGQRRSVVLSVPVNDPGTYYVVFDNRFSALSAKNVQADIRFVHRGVDTGRAVEVKRQATERERRIGGILSKLVVKLQEGEKQLGTHQIQTPIYIGVIDDSTLNAFAVWQKRAVVITRGTMELVESMPSGEADDVLGGVLAHELSHIFYRHSFGNEPQAAGEAAVSAGAAAVMINPLVGLAVMGLALDRNKQYDRMQETEADILGVRLACAAGFNPSGLLTFMERLSAQDPSRNSFLKNHPSPKQRVEYLQKEIGKLKCARAADATPAPAAAANTEKAAGVAVDFRNFTFPRAGGACLSEHAVTVRDGEYKREAGANREYFWVVGIVFGALSGAPGGEAVVIVKCSGGGSGVFSEGLVFGLKEGKPVFLATFDGGDRAQGGISGARIDRQRLLVERMGGSSMATPEYLETRTYRLAGDRLIEVAAPARKRFEQK